MVSFISNFNLKAIVVGFGVGSQIFSFRLSSDLSINEQLFAPPTWLLLRQASSLQFRIFFIQNLLLSSILWYLPSSSSWDS